MKVCLALVVLAIGLCVVPSIEAYWGWGMGGMGSGLSYYSPLSYWGFPYYRYYRDTMSKGDIINRINCRYIKERSVLSCAAQSGSVDCAVVANFTGLGTKQTFELYGIGRLSKQVEQIETPIQDIRWGLYPRQLDNTAWWNYTMVVEGKTVELSLFHLLSDKYFGYRVTDLKCYERLINLFRTVDVVNYERVVIVNENGVNKNCSLVGEILIDTPVRV